MADSMHPLDMRVNKRLNSQPQYENFDEQLGAYNEKQSQKGVLPWINNALSNVNEGLTQVAETPYNIMNRAPQLMNLLPGEQGMGTVDEMAAAAPPGVIKDVTTALFPSKDPLIDLAKEYHGGIQDDNPNYPGTSQFFEDVGMGVGSLGAGPLLSIGKASAGPITQKVGQYGDDMWNMVKANPLKAVGAEVAASGGAATGRGIAEETEMGPVASFFAELMGSMSPSIAATSLPRAATHLLGREGAEESLEAMTRQNVRPSVGLTGSRTAGQIESGASALPLFSSVPENVRTQQFDQFSDALTGAADNVRPNGPMVGEMGEQIYDIAEGGAQRMKAGFSGREDDLMKAIGADTPVNTTGTREALEQMLQTADAKTADALQNEIAMLDRIADEAGNAPYGKFRNFRSNFGAEIQDTGILSGAQKQMYAGATQDLQEAATKAGVGDDFKSLMSEQAAAHADDVRLSEGGDFKQAKSLKGGQIERSQAFLKQAYKNPDKMQYLQRNATPEQWSQLRADIAHDLGLAKAGAQDAGGEVISPSKFSTEWAAMDPRVKNMLFDDDLGTRQTLDDLALIAEDFQRRGLEANSSRTAGTGMGAMQIKEASKGAAMLGMGAAGASDLGLTAAASGITYASLKGLMSETLARWAAGQTPTFKGSVAPRIPGAIGRASTDEEK